MISALERQSERFTNGERAEEDWDERLFQQAIDETGTVTTIGLTDSDSDSSSINTDLMELDKTLDELF